METHENVQFSLFSVQEEGLYSRCLFKHISVNELESELKKRNITIYPSDSYHILTVKLKLNILETSDSLPDVRKDLEEEMEDFYIAYSVGVEKQNTGYKCCLVGCKFKARNHKVYVKHLQFHDSFLHKVMCQLKGCQREFSNVSMLKTHIKTCHRQPRTSTVSLRQNQLIEELAHLRCLQTECGRQTVSTLADLKKHLKCHTDKRDMVFCPFAGCSYETNVSGSFKSHLSRKHPLQQVQGLKSEIVSEASRGVIEDVTANSEVAGKTTEDHFDELIEQSDEDEDSLDLIDDALLDEENFVKSLSIVFNNWMNVAGIPYSTVNLIVSEVFKSYQMGADLTKHHIRNILISQGFDEKQVQDIIENVGKDDPFNAAKKNLESEKKRLTFIKEAFKNTQPETVRLNPAHEAKSESYQYVSLKGSIKNLLEDESYINQKKSDPYRAEEGVVKDVRDGKLFHQNPYFQKNPEAVPILIFQDELEVCNPLGSGKSKHKVNVTYYTTLDVQSPLRSRVKSIQLVSLVMSKVWKKYGNEKCNDRLIADLMELESDGIEVYVPEKKVVKVALCYIVGDNLGLHQLAEFSANFSSGQICRVCQATYEDVCKKHRVYADIEEDFHPIEFTKDSYDAFANLAIENEKPSPETMGIKGNCCFNKLQSYHCVEGMPPCLGRAECSCKYAINTFL